MFRVVVIAIDCIFHGRFSGISLEVGTPDYNPYSNLALSVEQCDCPPNYVGLSCEECADGFYRVPNGPFGGYCIPCQCNGHAFSCDKVTGICHVSLVSIHYAESKNFQEFEVCSASIAAESHRTNWNQESDNGRKAE